MDLAAFANSADVHHSVDKVNLNDFLNEQQNFIYDGLDSIAVADASAGKMRADCLGADIAESVIVLICVFYKRNFAAFGVAASGAGGAGFTSFLASAVSDHDKFRHIVTKSRNHLLRNKNFATDRTLFANGLSDFGTGCIFAFPYRQ